MPRVTVVIVTHVLPIWFEMGALLDPEYVKSAGSVQLVKTVSAATTWSKGAVRPVLWTHTRRRWGQRRVCRVSHCPHVKMLISGMNVEAPPQDPVCFVAAVQRANIASSAGLFRRELAPRVRLALTNQA